MNPQERKTAATRTDTFFNYISSFTFLQNSFTILSHRHFTNSSSLYFKKKKSTSHLADQTFTQILTYFLSHKQTSYFFRKHTLRTYELQRTDYCDDDDNDETNKTATEETRQTATITPRPLQQLAIVNELPRPTGIGSRIPGARRHRWWRQEWSRSGNDEGWSGQDPTQERKPNARKS